MTIRFRGVPNFCCFEVCKSGARKHTKIGPLNPPILGQKKGGWGGHFPGETLTEPHKDDSHDGPNHKKKLDVLTSDLSKLLGEFIHYDY